MQQRKEQQEQALQTGRATSPERSSNLTDDRISSDDGPDSLHPNTSAKDMDAEQAVSPGHSSTLNRRSTRLSALQQCHEKVKKRKHQTHKQLIHGEDTYQKTKLDLKAINEFVNNTKECEPAPPIQVECEKPHGNTQHH